MQDETTAGDPGRTPSPADPAARAGQDRGTELDDERAALKALRDQLAALSEQVAERERTLKEKAARESERKALVDAYEKAASRWSTDLETAKSRIAQELRMAETAVKDRIPAIDAIVKSAGDRVSKADGEAASALSAWTRLQGEQAALDAAADEAHTAHAAAAGRPKTIEASLRELKGLTDQAAKAEASDTYPAMYFLLSEASAFAGSITIPTAQQYDKDVKDSAKALDSAKGDAAKHKRLLDPAKTDAAAKLKAADAARLSRRADVLEQLKSVPASTPSTAAAR